MQPHKLLQQVFVSFFRRDTNLTCSYFFSPVANADTMSLTLLSIICKSLF